MVSVGSRALPSRRLRNHDFSDSCFMGGEDSSSKQSRKKMGMRRKGKKESAGFDGDNSGKNVSGKPASVAANSKRENFRRETDSGTSVIRKQVDPETLKYFSEIFNLFESNEIEVEERSVICGNALAEASGKELELATDYIISHTLQTLVEGCDADQLCSFLRGCINVFHLIAMDRSGSHVAESALKSLALHLQDSDTYSLIQETVAMICEVIVVNTGELICNGHGSHVLRRFLCLCQGVPLDSIEFHGGKTPAALAERLNMKPSELGASNLCFHEGFPDLLKLLVSGMVKTAKEEFKTLQVNQHASLVLQTALKLLAGQDQELLQVILPLIGCFQENMDADNSIDRTCTSKVVNSLKETAYSHLMEVILEVSPGSLYNQIWETVFKNSLFELSSDPCGNFAVQALISHARSKDQIELMLKEIGPKFRVLLELGRSGVIASLLAASQRLQTNEYQCCEALTSAVCSTNESASQIVPRILFLDNYFRSEVKSNWSWPRGSKMHVMGSLILQTVFRFESEVIGPFISSITSMEPEHTLEAAKDAGGAHVIEAFLTSNATIKQKRRLLVKLRGHYGEIAMHPSGSFTVEKCFVASNLSLKEAIVAELVSVQTELSKSRQGPYILRKLDVAEYAFKPDRWRARQESKKSAYNEFYEAFGSGEGNSRKVGFLSDGSKNLLKPDKAKNTKQEIDDVSVRKGGNLGKRKGGFGSEGTSGSTQEMKAVSENKIPFLSYGKRDKKRPKNL